MLTAELTERGRAPRRARELLGVLDGSEQCVYEGKQEHLLGAGL